MKRSIRLRRLIFSMCAYLLVCGLYISPVAADSKVWDGGGDGSTWADTENWHPDGIPTSGDDVTVDAEDASVLCERTFNAKSVTVGGRQGVTLTSDDFIYGTIEPDDGTEVAILNRRDGHIVLRGAGTLTVRGQYKDSESELEAEPSFIFWVE